MPATVLSFNEFEAAWLAGELNIEIITARGASTLSFIGTRLGTDERFFKVTGL